MVTSSFYESDNRVMRYAEALSGRGDQVEVLALRRAPSLPKEEVINGVRVFRIQERYGKREQGKASYLMPLLRFLVLSSAWLARRSHPVRYDLLHVHNIPDFLVFAAWYPKLLGARVILDIHDIVPELFASKFKAADDSRLVRALQVIERLSAAFADHVIIANHLWLKKYTARSADAEKCSVFINHVDERVFRSGLASGPNGHPVILFPGSLQWHQGLDLAIRAFGKVRERIPGAEFHIYGDGGVKPDLVALTGDLGLDGSVRFMEPLRLQEIASVMAGATLGVVPKRADSFGDQAYSTKIMEFMAVGVPVVVSETSIDRYYFDDSVVRFFESGNVAALAEAMLELLSDSEAREQMVEKAAEYAARNSWRHRKPDYLRLVDSMCEQGITSNERCASIAN